MKYLPSLQPNTDTRAAPDADHRPHSFPAVPPKKWNSKGTPSSPGRRLVFSSLIVARHSSGEAGHTAQIASACRSDHRRCSGGVLGSPSRGITAAGLLTEDDVDGERSLSLAARVSGRAGFIVHAGCRRTGTLAGLRGLRVRVGIDAPDAEESKGKKDLRLHSEARLPPGHRLTLVAIAGPASSSTSSEKSQHPASST